jgi:mannitol/fructose-specific phosphotransferase system IIA component (Ntr-type)
MQVSSAMDVKLSSFFSEKHVLCQVEGIGRDECLRRLVGILAAEGRIKNHGDALSSVIVREGLASPNIIPGLTIPHTRLAEMDRLAMAVATSAKGIDFGIPQGLIHVIVMILTPINEPGLYLQALAGVAHLFSGKGTVEQVGRLRSARDVWEFFDKGETALPKFVTARDIMATSFDALRATDFIEKAIDLFCFKRLYDIPVVDEDGDLVGVMNEERLIKLALPEYVLWLQDLSPILQFEPFAGILKNEKTQRVAEVMSTEFASLPEDAPAIQVARTIMRLEVRAVMVTRGKKLVGVITLADFLTKIFRK